MIYMMSDDELNDSVSISVANRTKWNHESNSSKLYSRNYNLLTFSESSVS